MLDPPSGRVAFTPEQYIHDSARRSTGNWGSILKTAFEDEGGVPGEHNPQAAGGQSRTSGTGATIHRITWKLCLSQIGNSS